MIGALYYTKPSQEIFDEVKEKAIAIWKTYDDTYGYASSKINQFLNLQNYSDNLLFIVGMFDIHNQAKLADKLSPEAKEAIGKRLKAGGTPDSYNVFL